MRRSWRRRRPTDPASSFASRPSLRTSRSTCNIAWTPIERRAARRDHGHWPDRRPAAGHHGLLQATARMPRVVCERALEILRALQVVHVASRDPLRLADIIDAEAFTH